MQNVSPAQLLASLSESGRQALLSQLSTETKAHLRFHWPFWARPNQLSPEGDWSTWLALAGRGFGKTEAGAQWIRQRIANGARSIALIAETQKDLEEVMVARLIAIHPQAEAPQVRFKPVRMIWPNGAIALGYNGTEPDQLRGPEFDTAWCDELAKYRYARETWDMLQFTMRKGNDPRVFVTTTPRPIPLIRELVRDPTTVVTRGSTFDNAVNLAPQFLSRIADRYEGTRLGRQELGGEILEDSEGALWSRAVIDELRVLPVQVPQLTRVVVAIDPAVTSGEDADETGIIAAGLGVDGHGYVLEDSSGRYSPTDWAKQAISLYKARRGDRIIAEVNNGGEMVENTIRVVDTNVPYKAVHASRGKAVRAEPVSALYEQKRVHHVGAFPVLEDQMCTFTSDFDRKDGSPDRMDALVWAFTELMVDQPAGFGILDYYRRQAQQQLDAHPELADGVPKVPGRIPSLVPTSRGPAMRKMKAPAGISTAYGRKDGRCYSVGADGCITVDADDAAPLIAAGFAYV